VRIEGTSGVGKTRLALEALATVDLSPLVAYLVAASDIDVGFLNSMIRRNHDVILVVDECPVETHRIFEKRLQAEGRIRLVTIGPSGELDSLRTGVLRLGPLEPSALTEFLQINYPSLSDQRRRYVLDVSGGVVAFAVQIGSALARLDEADAAELMRHTDVPSVVAVLVGDLPLAVVRSLALFRRIGWEDEKAAQARQLATWLGIDEASLRDVGEHLQERGLVERQGRYRLVSPFPVAVSLAAQAWDHESRRIVSDLIPALDAEGRTALLARAADLGRFPPAGQALEALLAPNGPFGTIESLEAGQEVEMLGYLSVVAPERATQHLYSIIEAASLEALTESVVSRRSLVWSLEKLAWHPDTFERAADSLLRLALAENEAWSNSATGTWVDLFGARLPSTAASPEARLGYLQDRATHPDPEVRRVVVTAASRAIRLRETRSVSAELQQGAAVREAGFTPDRQTDQTYREAMLSILATLSNDEAEVVSSVAAQNLIDLGFQLADTYFWPAYVEAARRLPADRLTLLRREAQRWLRLVQDSDRRGGEEQLGELVASLEVEDPMEKLKDLGTTPAWNQHRDEVAEDASALLLGLRDADRLDEVWAWMRGEEVPAAYSIGQALAGLPNADGQQVLDEILTAADPNLAAIGGFLDAAESAGIMDRDEFIDSGLGIRLTAEQRARLSMAPEPSGRSMDRITELVEAGELPPFFARVLGLGGWSRNYSPREFASILSHWTDVSTSESEVAALTHLLALHLHRQEGLPAELSPVAWSIIEKRREHVQLGTAEWDWGEIAKRLVEEDPLRIADLIFSMIGHGLVMLTTDSEAEVVSRAAVLRPEEVWSMLTRYLDGDRGHVVEMTVRGWLLRHFPIDVVAEWISKDDERAELMASLAPVDRAGPGEVVRWLLARFPKNERVRAALRGRFYEGGWTGPMSEWIGGLISDLEQWTDQPNEVRAWAREFIEYLREDQGRARQDEEERGF